MERYVREDGRKLIGYDFFDWHFLVKVDANEGIDWMDGLCRYPSDRGDALCEALAARLGKKREEILLGNGSSELIDLCMKAYLECGDAVVTFGPTFSLYQVFTTLNRGTYQEYPLQDMRELDVEGFIALAREKRA